MLNNTLGLLSLYLVVHLVWYGSYMLDMGGLMRQLARAGEFGSDAAIKVSDAAVKVATHGLAIYSDAWRGVELYDVHLRKRQGAYLLDDATLLCDWLQSDDGHRVWPLPATLQDTVCAQLRFLGWRTPFSHINDNVLNVMSNATAVEMASWLDDDGYARVQMRLITVTWSARWINPLWFSTPHSEAPQVMAIVKNLVNESQWQDTPPRRMGPAYSTWGSTLEAAGRRHGRSFIFTFRRFVRWLLMRPDDDRNPLGLVTS